MCVALCPRVILIHHGRLLYDGALSGLAERLAPFKLIRLTLEPRTVVRGELRTARTGVEV